MSTESKLEDLARRVAVMYDTARDIERAIELLGKQSSKPSCPLFCRGHFKLHSGSQSSWKIDCDALTDADWETLAHLAFDILSAKILAVEGVPGGGLKLAEKLRGLVMGQESRSLMNLPEYPLVICDDVCTTGASLERQRAGRNAAGVVVFARGPVPRWVKPLFTWYGA